MMARTTVQQLQVSEGSIRPTYVEVAEQSTPRTMPMILADIVTGALPLRLYTADSVGVAYRDANGKEMYAVIHGASKRGFARKIHDARLTDTGAAELEHDFIQSLFDPKSNPIIAYDVNLLVNEEIVPTEEVYAVVMTREDARNSINQMQSRKDAKANRVGIAMAGNAREWRTYVDKLPRARKKVGVWIPSEILSDEPYGEHARARLLHLNGGYKGLGSDILLYYGARFVGVPTESAAQAPEALEAERRETIPIVSAILSFDDIKTPPTKEQVWDVVRFGIPRIAQPEIKARLYKLYE